MAAAAKENEQLKMLEPLAIRTMSKAEYSSENIGHYGLGFQYYSHFTSPIRRYSDVLTHRILFKNLEHKTERVDKDALEQMCKHISIQERNATQAERESIKYKQVEYMEDQIGNTFDGRISGMIEKGIFVELLDSKAEGLIKFSSLTENYDVADSRLVATGRRTGDEIKMGDRVQVKVLGTNIDNRLIDFELLEMNN